MCSTSCHHFGVDAAIGRQATERTLNNNASDDSMYIVVLLQERFDINLRLRMHNLTWALVDGAVNAMQAKLLDIHHRTRDVRQQRRSENLVLALNRSDYMLDEPSGVLMQVGSLVLGLEKTAN